MVKKLVPIETASLDVTAAAAVVPDTSSRPIVVSNRPMIANDPMMVKPQPKTKSDLPSSPPLRTGKTIERSEHEPASTDQSAPDNRIERPAVAATLQPITDVAIYSKSAETPTEPVATTSKPETAAEALAADPQSTPAQEAETSKAETAPRIRDAPLTEIEQISAEEKQLEAETIRQAALDELISKGTYAVPIGTDRNKSRRTLTIAFIGIALLGLVTGDAVLDICAVSTADIPHTHFLSKQATSTQSSALGTIAPRGASPAAQTLPSAITTLAAANVTSIATALESFRSQNQYYPAELSAATLTQIDPTVLSPPAGVLYRYVPLPTGCSTMLKNCKTFTISALTVATKAIIASKQSTITQ